tara:strand:- start:50 stop:784 length:735 start_codon:yes stop_codon:yes gene_type:complete
MASFRFPIRPLNQHSDDEFDVDNNESTVVTFQPENLKQERRDAVLDALVYELGLNTDPINKHAHSRGARCWNSFWLDFLQHRCCSKVRKKGSTDDFECGWRMCCSCQEPNQLEWSPVVNTSVVRHNVFKIVILIVLVVFTWTRLPDVERSLQGTVREVKTDVDLISNDISSVSSKVPQIVGDVTNVSDYVRHELPNIEHVVTKVEQTASDTSAFVDAELPRINETLNVLLGLVLQINATLARLT